MGSNNQHVHEANDSNLSRVTVALVLTAIFMVVEVVGAWGELDIKWNPSVRGQHTAGRPAARPSLCPDRPLGTGPKPSAAAWSCSGRWPTRDRLWSTPGGALVTLLWRGVTGSPERTLVGKSSPFSLRRVQAVNL